MAILYDANTLYVVRGAPRKRTVYTDEDCSIRLSVNWSDFLASGDSIVSSTWTVEDSNSLMTLSSPDYDSAGVGTEVYASISEQDQDIYAKNTITTTVNSEIYTVSILVRSLRIA